MTVSFSIQVSLGVFKALTARLEEGRSHDDILRDLLDIESIVEPEREIVGALSGFSDGWQQAIREQSGKGGFYSRGLWLPDGTQLRARYKQKAYLARIAGNAWLDEKGQRHSSPSAAATAITNTNVNGLRFWEARRPEELSWRRLDILAEAK